MPLRKVIWPTHFVLCTPGRAGTMIRAGNPWSIDRSAPLTFSASSASSAAIWPPVSDGLAQHALRLQRLDEHLARARRARPLGQQRERHAGPLLRRRPALDAGDRQLRRALRQRQQLVAGERRPRRRRRAARAGSPAPVISGVTPRGARRVLLIGKSPATSSRRGARNASLRSGPPTDWPTLATSSRPAPAPAKANSPRREIVGSAGFGVTSPSSSAGSGSRVREVVAQRLEHAALAVGLARSPAA